MMKKEKKKLCLDKFGEYRRLTLQAIKAKFGDDAIMTWGKTASQC